MADVFGQSLSLLLVIAGVALAIAEAFAPGAHFIVVGVGLLVAGLVGLAFAPLATPFALGLLVLLAGGVTLYVYRRFDFYQGTGSGQTQGASDLRGARGHVLERVTPRSGRVKLESGGFDPTYAARSPDGEIEAGEDVVVVDPGGGNVLTVEAVGGLDDIDRELAQGRAPENATDPDHSGSSEGAGRE